MFKSQHFAHKVFIKKQLQEWILCILMHKSHRALSFRCFSHLFPTYVIPSTDKRSVQQSNSIFVAAQWKHVPRKTRGTRLRIGCLILSCKVFLNELSPREHLLETLRVGLDLHVRQILKKELDIISGRKVGCLCCFHNAEDAPHWPLPRQAYHWTSSSFCRQYRQKGCVLLFCSTHLWEAEIILSDIFSQCRLC